MSDRKLNEKLHGAARKGAGAAGRGIRHAVHNMRIWQKAGLVLCVLFWAASVVLGAVLSGLTGHMPDQNAAQRWDPDGGSAQVSSFLAEGTGASDETVKALRTGLMQDLTERSIVLSDQQIENGASLIDTCYCGVGQADLSTSAEAVSVTALGVGGDFFTFHPLNLISGYYFSEDDLMQDRILLDDNTAWRLFGSPYVEGMCVMVGGAPHFVAGVFRRPEGKFYREAGMGDYMIFMSYDSLCRYTEAGVPASGDSGGEPADDDSMDTLDARAVPRTAAYMPAQMPSGAMTPSPSGLSSAGEEDSAENPADAGDDEPAEEKEAASDTEEEDADADRPLDGDSMGGGSAGTYRGSNSGDGSDGEEKEEVNRSRMNCFEAILPNPVSGFALSRLRSRLEQLGFGQEQMTVVDNTNRFDILRLISMLAQPGVRSMQTAAIRYPYWENVALGWEDLLIPYALLWMILRYAPFVFLLILLIWYMTHKSWSATSIARDIQDRIYDRQSEKIYGKTAFAKLSDSGAADQVTVTEGLPDRVSEDSPAEDAKDRPGEDSPAEDAKDRPGEDSLAEDAKDRPGEDSPAEAAKDRPGEDGPADLFDRHT